MAFFTRSDSIKPLAARLLTRAELLEPELRQAILEMCLADELQPKLRKTVVIPRLRTVTRMMWKMSLREAMVAAELDELFGGCAGVH